jgi:hypothetical protein
MSEEILVSGFRRAKGKASQECKSMIARQGLKEAELKPLEEFIQYR